MERGLLQLKSGSMRKVRVTAYSCTPLWRVPTAAVS